jgi:hypothetical protein
MSRSSPAVVRDRYLRLVSCKHLVDASPEVFRYADTIRRASEWRTLGFAVNVSEYGNPERNDAHTYRFFVANEHEPDVQEAIATGKRAVVHPLPVFEYFRLGCALSEFASLPSDVPLYCQARSHYERGELLDALPLIEEACTKNPDEVRYREILYPLRLALGDVEAIAEELAYFRGDVDTMVHTGRAKEWLRLLQDTDDVAAREEIITEVESAFVALRSGQATTRRYGAQRQEWYERSHEKFRKLVTTRQRGGRRHASRPA